MVLIEVISEHTAFRYELIEFFFPLLPRLLLQLFTSEECDGLKLLQMSDITLKTDLLYEGILVIMVCDRQ